MRTLIVKTLQDFNQYLKLNFNRFDGGVHFYETYETKDGKYMTVGAIEPQFYKEIVQRLTDAGIENVPGRFADDQATARKEMADIFRQKTQSEWCAIFDDTDACIAPVLDLDQAPLHKHNVARGSFIQNATGMYSPAPAPRLSRTPAIPQNDKPEPEIGENSIEILQQFGYSTSEIDKLIKSKAVHQVMTNAKL